MNKLASVIIETVVPPKTVAMFWLEQSHFIIKTAGGILVHIDPFLSRKIKPENHIYPEPLMAPETAQADYVFMTHDHRDHCDPYTISPMARANPNCIFVGPPETTVRARTCGVSADKLLVFQEGDEQSFGIFKVKAVFAQDTTDDKDDATTHLGYVFDFAGVTIYNVGDTRNNIGDVIHRYDAVKDLHPEAMLVPINEGYNNPGPTGAAQLVEFVKPHLIVPCHFDCFRDNTIAPSRFIEALPQGRRGDVRIMARGDRLFISSS
jgi:L-ascorbate metabolism protein UlaG (beta-lactamase superfamily)